MAFIYRFGKKNKKTDKNEDASLLESPSSTLITENESETAPAEEADSLIRDAGDAETEEAIVFSSSREDAPELFSEEADDREEEAFPSPDSEEELVSAPLEPSNEETAKEEEEVISFSETRELPLEEPKASLSQEAEEEADSGEITRAFDPAALSDAVAAAEDASLPEEKTEIFELPEAEDLPPADAIVKALNAENAINAAKLDEVFGKKRHSARDTEEDDSTTALLREVFGIEAEKGKKKKKKKKSDSFPSESSKSNAISLEEALEQVHAKNLEEASKAESKSDGAEEYVAVHDGAEESTKEFTGNFSIEEVLKQIRPEEQTLAVPPLAKEITVSDSDDDPYSDTYELEEEPKGNRAVLPEEFCSEEEYDEFAEHLRNNNFKALGNFFWSLLPLALLLYLESATFSNLYHPEFLKPGGSFNTIYLLVDIQLILISALLTFSLVADGIKGFFLARPNRNTLVFLALLFSGVHAGILLFQNASGYPLFGSLAALFATTSALAEYLESKRIYRSFRIVGRRGQKWVANPLSGECAEAEAFRDQLDGEPSFFSVKKTEFVDGFFHRVKAPSRGEKSYLAVLILSLLVAGAFAGYSWWKEPGIVLAANRFMTAFAMTCPLSGIFTVILPFSHLSRKAEKHNSAILSAKDAENYAGADVVSFTDKEIFPPKSVKVNTIRTYGQTRIDKAILYAAMIFQKLGGPLSLVFKKTISGVYSDIPENFDFLEITADGMCAKIEGKDVFVGNKNYLLAYDFGYTKDEIDQRFEDCSGKIMYMVIGSELAAKFYIRYSISSRFKKTILSLFKCGICPAVKTCDPNIDGDLFRALLKNRKIPAGVIKTCDAMKDAPVEARCESGIVCNTTISGLLHGFTICESLRHLIRSNIVIKIISLLLGFGIVAFLFFFGDLSKISGLFALVYQLLWIIPVMIPSLTE